MEVLALPNSNLIVEEDESLEVEMGKEDKIPSKLDLWDETNKEKDVPVERECQLKLKFF